MKVDCHCHILPGLDDGAQSLEESVFLAGKLASWGYERVVCTSHSSFLYRNTPMTVTSACELLRQELLSRGISLELVHPERYLYLTMEDYRLLKEAGAQFQRNLGTLEGMHGEAVSVRAEALQAEDMYEWVGSDLHNARYAAFFDRHVLELTQHRLQK